MANLATFKKNALIVEKVNYCLAVCLNIALVIALGIYAFNNPDADASYAVVNGEMGMFTEEELVMIIQSNQYVVQDIDDVHRHFTTWSLWGFITMIFGFCYCGLNILFVYDPIFGLVR